MFRSPGDRRSTRLPITRPSFAHHARPGCRVGHQWGRGTWELRVYLGLDPDTGRRRYATRTVHGTRRAATAALAELVEDGEYCRVGAGTVGELLERWMTAAAPAWSASTVRETRSLMRCHLLPHLGHIHVTKLTAADTIPTQTPGGDRAIRAAA